MDFMLRDKEGDMGQSIWPFSCMFYVYSICQAHLFIEYRFLSEFASALYTYTVQIRTDRACLNHPKKKGGGIYSIRAMEEEEKPHRQPALSGL